MNNNINPLARIKQAIPCLKEYEAPVGLSLDEQKNMYRTMCLIREFDTQVRTLWMENKIYGLAHSYVGAEAIAVGACAAIRTTDYITSTHRGHGHTIAKGANIRAMMAELFGKYEGLNRGKGGSMHIADIDIGMLGATGIVGSGMPIALGSSLSAKILGKDTVTICFHGDGSTNQGVWHESINMAAAWDLPAIFLIENNQYAIATELCCISKETDLYKRAVGYGIEGIQIDGFNVFEVYNAVSQAALKARKGGGPTLIEARFMRILGHFVADDQWYRNTEEANLFWEVDPIIRMRQYFLKEGLLEEKEIDALQQSAQSDVIDAINYAQNECTEPPEETLYSDIYADGEIIR